MCKKLINLVSFVFVIALFMSGPAKALDPSLQLWLEFEDNVNDSSDYARHGTLTGGGYAAGVSGQAVDLNGNPDHVSIVGWKGVTGTQAFSIAAWVQTTDAGGVLVAWGFPRGGGDNGLRMEFRTNSNRFQIENGAGSLQGDTQVTDGDWHHVAVTHKAGTNIQHPDTIIYLDGFDDTRLTTGNGTVLDSASDLDVTIGREHDRDGRWFNAAIDDLHIYDKVLTVIEIRELAGILGPVLSEPANDSALEAQSAQFKWEAAPYAAETDGYDVYYGELWADVNAGTGGTFIDSTSGLSYGPVLFDLGTTYYWKIVAVNDLHPDEKWESEIWSFTVPEDTAWGQFPAHQSGCVDPNVTLEWKAGMGGKWNDIYFGENPVDVNNDVNNPPGSTFQVRQEETSYPVGPLETDTEYFWRVDTLDGGLNITAKGAVWSFTTRDDKPITDDPNLVGCWRLDEICPGIVVDDSGYEHYGRLINGAGFVPGYQDQAVEFDGIDDYATIDGYKGILGTHEFSVAAWIKTMTNTGNDTIIGWGAGSGGARICFRLDGGNATPFSVRYAQGNGNVQGNTAVNDGEWHHVAMTVESGGVCSSSYIRIYVDGQDDTVSSSDTDLRNTPADADVGIGLRASDGDQHFEGLIDEVRLYNRVLSPYEVQRLMDPAKAINPRPEDEGYNVEKIGTKLIWTPGIDEATGIEYTKSRLYFGESPNDVNASDPGVYIDEFVGVNEWTPPLEYFKTYFWRVNGINASAQEIPGNVWSFKVTFDPGQVDDPNLLAWYKFDGDANDSSGHRYDLTVISETDPGPGYAGGFDGQAIQLDGDDDYAEYTFPEESVSAYTIMMWAKTATLVQNSTTGVFSSHFPNNTGFQLDIDGSTPPNYRYHESNTDSIIGPVTTGWVHLAVAFDGNRMTLFYNGNWIDPVVPVTADSPFFNRYAVGANRNNGNLFEGAVDEVRIYNYEIEDEADIQAIMRINLAWAWMPEPPDGAYDAPIDATLSWRPGEYVPPGKHNVYFGTDADNLAWVDGPKDINDYTPSGLIMDTTYYWKVGETNAPEDIRDTAWSFTTSNYQAVDDMDLYDNTPGSVTAVWNTWKDGYGINGCGGSGNETGSAIDYEPSNVHSEPNAMKFIYENDGSVTKPPHCDPLGEDPRLLYSEAKAEIADLPSLIDSNWLKGGAKVLSLWFLGDVNEIEPMSVELTDGSGGKASVHYGFYPDEDINDVNDGSWHEWNIALQDFNDGATPVDLTDVNSIAIIIGNKYVPTAGGAGIVYFDDIQLQTSKCLPERAKPRADFDNSCEVGYGDLEVMTRDWLISSYDFTVATSVSDANLEARYEFDGNLQDGSVNLRHADPCGTIGYAADRFAVSSMALDIVGAKDSNNYCIVPGYEGVLGTQDRTTCAWIKTPGANLGTITIVSWGPNNNGQRWTMRINLNDTGVKGAIRADVSGGSARGSTDLRDGEWHHVAAVLRSDGSPDMQDVEIYADGMRDALSNWAANDIDTVGGTDVTIGRSGWTNNHRYTGQIDELRIYSRALSHGEIANLAGMTVGTNVTQPLWALLETPGEDTDLADDEIINFIDYAELLNAWLDEVLWP